MASLTAISGGRVYKIFIRVWQGLMALFIRQYCKEIVSTFITALIQVSRAADILTLPFKSHKPDSLVLNHFHVTNLVLEDWVSYWRGIFNMRTTHYITGLCTQAAWVFLVTPWRAHFIIPNCCLVWATFLFNECGEFQIILNYNP